MTLQIEKNLESKYVMPTFGRSDVEFVEGEGMHLRDSDGKEYIDFLSGIGVCSLGHCHHAVVDAISKQAQELIHVSNYFYIENRGEVAEKLSNLLSRTPDHMTAAEASVANSQATAWKSFFANSGAEANECAIKLARINAKAKFERLGKDPASAPSLIITLVRSFHGRTLATLAATGQSVFHKGFEPIPEGFLPTPINDIESLRNLFEQLGGSICAVMIECIQGESGVHVCEQDFVKEVRELCDKHEALMICDEVQCGIFRTGEPFAFQHYGVVPDIVTIAKGIASGFPTAACSAKAHIADVMQPGKHGSTFGGSNLAMAAARATLEQLDSPSLMTQIRETGAYLMQRLQQLPQINSVRGMGLMVGADINDNIDAHDVVKGALRRGLVINATGPNTLRFLPPLICTKDDVDEAMEKLVLAIS